MSVLGHNHSQEIEILIIFCGLYLVYFDLKHIGKYPDKLIIGCILRSPGMPSTKLATKPVLGKVLVLHQ